MSNAKPMRPVARASTYIEQEALRCEDAMQRRPLTPAQRRRIKHKNHRMLGAAGGGVLKPKQVKTRQRRPAPVPGGLLALLSPKQIRKAVSARSARRGIKFNIRERPAVMIIDDMQRGNGDR